MRCLISIFLSAATVALLALGAFAQEKPYSLEDLQALDKSGAWSELRWHLTDIPPSKRGPQWNRIAEHACLRPADEYYAIESCARVLEAATASEPKNKDFSLRVATFFAQTRFQSLAVPFFARVITLPNDAQCAVPELSKAVVAGLKHSPTPEDRELIAQAQKLAFALCWPETRERILAVFDRSGDTIYLHNTCPYLKHERALTPSQDTQCDRAAEVGH